MLLFNIGFNKTSIDPVKYRDFSIPVKNDTRGLLIELQDLNCVKNGLKNILSWQQGWRILNPQFGNILTKYIAEPINSMTSAAIKNEIETLLPKWEPRITLQKVTVDPEEDQNQYNIEIVYLVKPLDVEDTINFTLLAGNI